jgi:hypothetical protein
VSRIVTTHYRYKRPPRTKKAVALEVPTIVAKANKRRPKLPGGEPQAATSSPDAATSAIVTARKPGRSRFAEVTDMTP